EPRCREGSNRQAHEIRALEVEPEPVLFAIRPRLPGDVSVEPPPDELADSQRLVGGRRFEAVTLPARLERQVRRQLTRLRLRACLRERDIAPPARSIFDSRVPRALSLERLGHRSGSPRQVDLYRDPPT